MEICLRSRDIEFAQISGYMEFSLYGREGGALMEEVDQLKYLGQTLYQSDNSCTKILRNIRRERKVWYRLGKILQGEGGYNQISTMFYMEVVQAVLLFG